MTGRTVPARKKLRAVLPDPFSGLEKKAARDFSRTGAVVAASMAKQAEVKKLPAAGLDACAEPRHRCWRNRFQLGAQYVQPDSDVLSRLAEQFGYYIGRWVYLMDAADDLEKGYIFRRI